MKRTILFLLLYTFAQAQEPISSIPLEVEYDKEKALLGKKLFFDPILSSDGSTSCFRCHNVYNGGADSNIVSFGVENQMGNIQSPTVLNARYNFAQFWNGRAKDLLEQAAGPLNNPVEHGMNKNLIEKKLNASSEYRELFSKTFHSSKVLYKDVLNAIVEFEKALVTPNAKFDKYLRGEVELSKEEAQGYKLFKQYGCITCHNGVNIGGNSFQQFGTFIEYKSKEHYPDRSEITHFDIDKNVFKVPTLRNIAKTAPYFHDGSSDTLEDAIKQMALYNLGIYISKKDIYSLKAFLETLTGEEPKILDEQ